MKPMLIVLGMILFPFFVLFYGIRALRVVHAVTHITDTYPLGAAN